MKTILCLILSLFYVNQVKSADNGLPSLSLPSLTNLQFPTIGIKLPSAAPVVPVNQPNFTPNFGFPRKQQPLPFFPVPIVKKVTHHHIHHVIAHKGVVKSKYSNEANNGYDLDNKDIDHKNGNQLNYKLYNEELGLKGDFNDNGYKSSFVKRGGVNGGANGVVPQHNFQHFGDLIASGTGFSKGPAIRGYFGGQKAEFVPLIIGLIDDSNDFMSGSDSQREFSHRKGLLRNHNKEKQYIPTKETMKLFEDLAKLGYK